MTFSGGAEGSGVKEKSNNYYTYKVVFMDTVDIMDAHFDALNVCVIYCIGYI